MYGLFLQVADVSFLDFSEFDDLPLDHLRTEFAGSAELSAAVDRAGLRKALRGAPVASWLLARLKQLSLSSSFPESYLQEEDDLGGYGLELLVAKGVAPVARLAVEADSGLIELFGEAASPALANEVVTRFVAFLMEQPLAVERCAFTVAAAELGGYENEYGWNGDSFLGAHNVSA